MLGWNPVSLSVVFACRGERWYDRILYPYPFAGSGRRTVGRVWVGQLESSRRYCCANLWWGWRRLPSSSLSAYGRKLRKGTGVAEWLAGYRRAYLVSGYPDNRILFAGINLSALVFAYTQNYPVPWYCWYWWALFACRCLWTDRPVVCLYKLSNCYCVAWVCFALPALTIREGLILLICRRE